MTQGIREQALRKPEERALPSIQSRSTGHGRVHYDESAQRSKSAPSLNECSQTGPPLQNKLLSVLAKNGFNPVALAGDLKQAFLRVRIREEDRDVMRFHWLKDLKTKQVETLRFTRALFGLSTSPFLLGGVIDQHLRNLQQNFPNEVEEVKRSLYVDNLITCVTTVVEKGAAQPISRERRFQLHKWHWNVPSLKVLPSSEKAAKEH